MKNYTITVNGVPYQVTVEENDSAAGAAPSASVQHVQSAQPASTEPPATAGSVTVEAPMPGNILEVCVTSGQNVKQGDRLIILEAMKMENEIVAPCNGSVASINVNKGEAVEAGQLLLSLN